MLRTLIGAGVLCTGMAMAWPQGGSPAPADLWPVYIRGERHLFAIK